MKYMLNNEKYLAMQDIRSSNDLLPVVNRVEQVIQDDELKKSLRALQERFPTIFLLQEINHKNLKIKLLSQNMGNSSGGRLLVELNKQQSLVQLLCSYLFAEHNILGFESPAIEQSIVIDCTKLTNSEAKASLLFAFESMLELINNRRTDQLVKHLLTSASDCGSLHLEGESGKHHTANHSEVADNSDSAAVLIFLSKPSDLIILDEHLAPFNGSQLLELQCYLKRILAPFTVQSCRYSIEQNQYSLHFIVSLLSQEDFVELTKEEQKKLVLDVARLAAEIDCEYLITLSGLGEEVLQTSCATTVFNTNASLVNQLLMPILDRLCSQYDAQLILFTTDESLFPSEGKLPQVTRVTKREELKNLAANSLIFRPPGNPPIECDTSLFPDGITLFDPFGLVELSTTDSPTVTQRIRLIRKCWLSSIQGCNQLTYWLSSIDKAGIPLLLLMNRSNNSNNLTNGLKTFASLPVNWNLDAISEPQVQVSTTRPAESFLSCPAIAYNTEQKVNYCDVLYKFKDHKNPALIDPTNHQAISYHDLYRHTLQWVELLNNTGVQGGDVVALMSEDKQESVEVMLAALWLGAIFCPINHTLSDSKLSSMLGTISPKVLLSDDNISITDEQAKFSTKHLILKLPKHITPSGDLSPIQLPGNFPAIVLFTSGSTGMPKAVYHSHSDIINCNLNYRQFIIDMRPTERVYCPSKMFFSYGLNNLLMTLHAGATFILAKNLNSDQNIYSVLRDFKINIMFSVPIMLKRLLSDIEGEPETRNLRLIVSAGESLPANLYRALQNTFKVGVLDGIGTTEVLSTFVSNRLGSSKAGSTGQVVPGFSVKLINEHGKPCQIGEVGNMWVKGITLANGYIGDPQLSDKSIVEGWFNTQDMFFMDAQYYFYYVGRSNTVVKINGCWFSPIVMEQILSAHPAVSECAVVFYQDEFGLHRPKAFIKVTVPDINRNELWEELKRFSCNQLGKDHYPHVFIEIHNLPRTSSGKLLRGTLNDL